MKTLRTNLIFITIVIVGFLFRYLNNFDQIFWNDENYTLFITDPKITFKEFLNRHSSIDENPKLYFYILRIFNYMSYSAENLRLSSIIFSTLTIVISFNFFKIFFDKKDSLICLALVSLNIFLIWQAKEARIASSLVFLGLLNILIFHKFLSKEKFKYKLSLFLINLFSLSYYPFLLMIILAQFFYILLNNRKKFKTYFFILVFSLIFYILFNIDYILLKTSKPSHHFPIEASFFINYFFRSFFGSIFFGGISLILFALSFLTILRKNKSNFMMFNIYLILISYFFAISYSLLKGGGVIAPRYYIFLIPSIISIIFNLLEKKSFKYLYLILTLVNSLIIFDNWKIQKPRISYLMNNLDRNITKYYFTDEGGHNGYDNVYDYYFKNSTKIKKHLNYIDIKNLNKYEKFYFICFNHAEMHVGLDRTIQDDKKCHRKIDNFDIVFEKEIKDFRIILFQKKNI